MRQQLNLYSNSECPLFKNYMETRRSEWEEDKEFTSDQVRAIGTNKYNNFLSSGRWSNKDSKDAQILAVVGLDQNLSDESKKLS